VDIEFDIGPEYYNFIDTRFIGEPVLRDRIYAPSQNVTYINNTVNVTNITVQNNVVYNYGPDYNVLSARASRPIQRLKIERQQTADLSTAARTGALTKVQGDKLVIGAPTKIEKAPTGAAPPKVKARVAQPKIQHGWTGVANEAQLKEKIKTENPKNIPPPTGAAATGQAAGGGSPAGSPSPIGLPARGPSPSVTASPAPAGGITSPAPFEKGRRKGKPGEQAQPGLTGTPGESPAGATTVPAPLEKGKRKGRPGEQPLTGTPGVTPAGAASPAGAAFPTATAPAPERGKAKGRRELGTSPAPPYGAPSRTAPPGQTGAAPVIPEATQPPAKHKGQMERGYGRPTPTEQPGGAANEPQQGQYKGRGAEQTGTTPATGAVPYETRGGKGRGQGAYEQSGAPPATGAASENRGGKQKGQGAYAQPGRAPGGESSAAGGPGQGKPQGGKKKGEKGSPTPGPQ
jgi:hypothetical protein